MILQGGEVNPESFCLLFLNNEKAEIKERYLEKLNVIVLLPLYASKPHVVRRMQYLKGNHFVVVFGFSWCDFLFFFS